MSRSDFIVSESGEIYFLEVNTIPGMTEESLFPKELKAAGITIKKLFEFWCKDVLEQKRPRRT